MHTVIITDRLTTPLFAMHRRLFAPFFVERGGSICHCPWHEGGGDIEQAVPDLYKAIKDHPVWRAVILVHHAQNEPLPYMPHNPFDFYCNRGSELPIKENPAPLVRLTHMLAGFPSLGIKEYKTGYTYYNAKQGVFLECKHKDGRNILREDLKELSNDELNKMFRRFGSNIKPRLIAIQYSSEEKAEYERLTKKYALKENRPAEVLVLSTRELFKHDDRETTREEVRRAWEFHDEEESSGFWKVYPNSCRFLCYDLINPEHTQYPREIWRFYLLALTLAVNQIPGQSLQAYRLYKADLRINADELKYILDGHIENLMSVQEVIQERLLHIPDLTQDKKKEIVPPQDISVKFEHVDEGDVRVDSSRLGLAVDCPVSEMRFWREYVQGTKQTIDNILFTPQEIVAAKALETRSTANSFADREQVLDRFQLERIHRRIDELEPQVMNTSIYGMLNADAHMAEMAEAGNTVRKFLGLRLTKRNALFISLCALLTYFCGYIPYLINSARISWPVFGASFGLTASTLVLLSVIGLLILCYLRHRLVKKLKNYNKTVRDIFNRINKSADAYSGYFSSICTYMYARSLLTGVILKHDNEYTAAKIQKAHLHSLKKEIEASSKLCSLHEVPSNASPTINVFMDIQEEALMEYPSKSRLYELAQNRVRETLELVNTGEPLYAPYTFIVGISLVREEIYDKGGA